MPIFPPNNEKIVHWYTHPKLEQLPHQKEKDAVAPVRLAATSVSDRAGPNCELAPRVYKLYEGGDQYGCKNCKIKGDKWYMEEHQCKGLQR